MPVEVEWCFRNVRLNVNLNVRLNVNLYVRLNVNLYVRLNVNLYVRLNVNRFHDLLPAVSLRACTAG